MCPTVLGVCVNEKKDDSPGILFIYWFHFQYLKEQLLNLICYVYCIWLYKTDDANGNSVHKNESVAIFLFYFLLAKTAAAESWQVIAHKLPKWLRHHGQQIVKVLVAALYVKCTILFCRYSKVHTLLNYSNMFSLQVNNKHNNK